MKAKLSGRQRSAVWVNSKEGLSNMSICDSKSFDQRYIIGEYKYIVFTYKKVIVSVFFFQKKSILKVI